MFLRVICYKNWMAFFSLSLYVIGMIFHKWTENSRISSIRLGYRVFVNYNYDSTFPPSTFIISLRLHAYSIQKQLGRISYANGTDTVVNGMWAKQRETYRDREACFDFVKDDHFIFPVPSPFTLAVKFKFILVFHWRLSSFAGTWSGMRLLKVLTEADLAG